MHELHVVQGIINQAIEKAKANKAAKITKIVLVVGELLGFDEGSIRLYFDDLSKGTLLEGAELTVKPVMAKFKCKECDQLFERRKGEFSCPKCCSLNLLTESGKEFFIDSMEIES